MNTRQVFALIMIAASLAAVTAKAEPKAKRAKRPSVCLDFAFVSSTAPNGAKGKFAVCFDGLSEGRRPRVLLEWAEGTIEGKPIIVGY